MVRISQEELEFRHVAIFGAPRGRGMRKKEGDYAYPQEFIFSLIT